MHNISQFSRYKTCVAHPTDELHAWQGSSRTLEITFYGSRGKIIMLA
jgi:hypothetical protein